MSISRIITLQHGLQTPARHHNIVVGQDNGRYRWKAQHLCRPRSLVRIPDFPSEPGCRPWPTPRRQQFASPGPSTPRHTIVLRVTVSHRAVTLHDVDDSPPGIESRKEPSPIPSQSTTLPQRFFSLALCAHAYPVSAAGIVRLPFPVRPNCHRLHMRRGSCARSGPPVED